MECPKCGLEIDNKAMVCPNCKKVLKLACPICKTINTTNTCRKCGYVIISKCHNCGKVNPTALKKCKKCGFDTEKSVILNESNSDNYTMLTIEFPNIDEMKKLLGTAKLYNKFRISLDKVIFDYVKSVGLRCQIYGQKYVIRCLKDYTFNGTAITAINTAIDLLNKITEMNCKLTKKKNATVRCNMLLLKKNVADNPNNIDSGFNISLLSQNAKSKEERILNTFQVLADDAVSEIIREDYRISPLNSVMIDGNMVMISEVEIKHMIKVQFPEDKEEAQEIEVPNFVQNMLLEQDKIDGEALNKMNSGIKDADSIYDIDTLNFEEIKCEFIRTENSNAVFHIMNKLQSIPNGIIALKTQEMYKPHTVKVLNAAVESNQFNNIISLTCYDEMKFSPYSFFRDLISAIFEYTISPELFSKNDFSIFSSIDPQGLIKDLISMEVREGEDIEDTRLKYYEIFLTLFKIIPKTLIYIEDFDKIDSSSYDIMKYIFSSFEQLDVSILLSYDKDFSLHKDCHFLLMQPYYTEITLKSTTFENLIESNKVYYKNILNDFYFHRIAKYACGSNLYIDIAIQYLVESGVYEISDNTIKMINPKTIIIPTNLDKLITRRLNLLQDDADSMRFLTSLVLLGTRIDMGTIEYLNAQNAQAILQKLSDMGYIYLYNNCIYFANYNLLKRNLLSTVSKIYLKETATELLDKVFNENDDSSFTEAYLYKILEDREQELKKWEDLAKIDLSLGDYYAYINCAGQIIEILNENENPENREEVENYKSVLYENISDYLHDNIPKATLELAETALKNIEKTSDSERVIRLCNKMINGALDEGDYNHALELMHKVLSMLPTSSIYPNDPNFNKYFFLMSVIHIQILFNIGALRDCLDIGYNILSVVNDKFYDILKPEYYTDEAFKNLIINSAGYVAMANVMLMTGETREYLRILKQEISFIPQSFDLFIALDDFIHGREISVDAFSCTEEDRFDEFIINIILAFTKHEGDYNKFAEFAYRAKISAKKEKLHQLELFADLLIAYAYMKVESYEKSEDILNKIIKETHNNGMINILYSAWYIMSELYLKQKQYQVAYGIINNSQIQLEKNNSTSEYLLMLFKYGMYKVLMYQNKTTTAEICINHAKYLANKYDINFDFDTDPSHYALETENITEDSDEDTVSQPENPDETEFENNGEYENPEDVSENQNPEDINEQDFTGESSDTDVLNELENLDDLTDYSQNSDDVDGLEIINEIDISEESER